MKKLQGLKKGTQEYENAYAELIKLQLEHNKLLEGSVDLERQVWIEKTAMAREYLDAMSDVSSGLADMSQGSMDLTNREYDNKAWAVEETVKDEKEKERQLYKIEMDRYDALKTQFELKKKFDEASAWASMASGIVGIWSAPSTTALGPAGAILAGIQSAALLATTVGNVKTIRAQQLDKPHSPSGSDGSSSGNYNIALNPTESALTSREENLNMMSKSGSNKFESTVKVSDINNVQNKVSVRDSINSY